ADRHAKRREQFDEPAGDRAVADDEDVHVGAEQLAGLAEFQGGPVIEVGRLVGVGERSGGTSTSRLDRRKDRAIAFMRTVTWASTASGNRRAADSMNARACWAHGSA